jgi:predicted transport protein
LVGISRDGNDAILVGHFDIGEHEIGMSGAKHLHARLSVWGLRNRITALDERVGENFAEEKVVFDEPT